MRRERACKGCDGTGSIHHYGAAESHTVKGCLACGCTGRVVDLIPAADAVADAETLLTNMGAQDYSPEWKCFVASPTSLSIRRAIMYADMAIRGARDFSRERSEEAARAAFRAVPGLRG